MAIRIVYWLLLLSIGSYTIGTAQIREIKGMVMDNRNEPLPAASITVKGTMNTTVTDMDGQFRLSVSLDSVLLEVRALGLIEANIWIAPGKDSIAIALKENALSLEEVAIYAQKIDRRSYIGSAAGVTATSVNTADKTKRSTTWKRSGLPENAIRLEVGDNEYLPFKAASMAVQVDGFRVRVLLDCFFYNDKQSGLEGVFKLKLPAGASPYYFAFGETVYTAEDSIKGFPYIDYLKQGFHLSPEELTQRKERNWSRVKEARVVSKQKAAQAYEETVSSRVDPALMEWAGADMFSCRVFPLTKGSMHRIVIGYDLNMTEALDFREYVLQLPEAGSLHLAADIADEGALVPHIQPAVPAAKAGKRLRFALQDPKTKTFTIRYDNVAPVQLYDSTTALFGSSYRISLPEARQPDLPTKAVFLLDLSLSANPDKFNVWLKLIEEVLSHNKDVIKQFAVLTFNVEQQWWQPCFLKNNSYNMYSFLDYAQTLALEGATDLGSALQEASHPNWLKKNEAKHIFLMTDGDYNWGESNLNALQLAVNKGDRIHTYKTGLPGTNTTVLNTLSKVTGGFAFTVTGEEEASLAAQSLRYRPWTIEEMKVDGVTDLLVSGQPTQLYNGQKLILSGRGRPAGPVYCKLNNGIETRELVLPAAQQLSSDLSARIYGQLALSYLQPYNEDKDGEKAVEKYAQHFRIPGETMSFLMLENDWSYKRFGIDDAASESYVQQNTIASLLQEWLQNGDGPPLGNGKTAFLSWLGRLRQSESLGLEADTLFMTYVRQLPEGILSPRAPIGLPLLIRASQQTEEELEMLGNEYLKYDKLLPLAENRKNAFGNPAALKLLSSVIERNPSDFIALRDMALRATDWGMGLQAYHMIKRIISAREEEALSYLIAARALERSGNYDLAQVYYYICTHTHWDRDYGSIREIAALYNYRMLDRILDKPGKLLIPGATPFYSNFREELAVLLKQKDMFIPEADIVMILSWNRDNTDIDLHVEDPAKEECYFGHRETANGGRLTIDVTGGFGPEMFVQEKAAPGTYRSWLEYYSDDRTKTSSKAKAYVELYKNWGRANEKLIRKLIILEKPKHAISMQEGEEEPEYEDTEFEIQKILVSKRIQ